MNSRNMGGRKKKRSARFAQDHKSKREMIYRQSEQEYGFVEQLLGDMRCLVFCSDRQARVCHIRGRFRRRVWINLGDVVLVSVREFEKDRGDIIYKYNMEEVEHLKSSQEFDYGLLKGGDSVAARWEMEDERFSSLLGGENANDFEGEEEECDIQLDDL